MFKPQNLLSFIFLFLAVFLFTSLQAQMRQIFADPVQAENGVVKASFYSPSEGYVAFSKWIGYTTDTGKTFTRKYITTSNVDYNGYNVNLTFGFGISGIKAFDKDNIIAYGDYGAVPAILCSADGGNTFKLIYQSQLNLVKITSGIIDLVFPQNGNTGFAVEADRIIKSTDKGKTWSTVLNSPNSFWDVITAVDNNTVFALSTDYDKNKLLKTADGGATWQQVTAPAGKITYVDFITVNKGWLATKTANSGLVYHTSNGGTTWELKNNPDVTPGHIRKMKFVNDNTGYAIAGLFHVYKTTDSGRIWEPLPRDNTVEYLGFGHNDLHFWNDQQFWAGGSYGLLELTTNAGGTPLPKALFKIDTTGLYNTKTVKLVNFSKIGYQYKWFKNDVLISTDYNTSYIHDNAYRELDTIKLVVINNGNSDTGTQRQYFVIPPPPPGITSFTPASAATGSTVSIMGTGFTGVTAVSFGGVAAKSFTVVSSTEIRAVVANGNSGDVTVTNTWGIGSKSGFTYLPPPVITAFTPTSGEIGATITITGSNFIGVTSVSFGGLAASSFNIVSPNIITAVIATGASGDVAITSPYGTGSLAGFQFITNAPTITSVNPLAGSIGSTVTITGTNFSNTLNDNIVYFGAVKSTVTAASQTTLKVIVPIGATYDYITVTNRNLTAYSLNPFVITFAGDTLINTRSFAAKADFATGNTYETGSITDIDGDGKADYAVSDFGANAISILRNTSNSGGLTFAPRTDITVGAVIRGHAFGDFDGDGKKDVVVTNYFTHNISVWKNTSTPGSISFTDEQNYPTREYPWTATAHDLDGDGKPDLIIGIEGDGSDLTWKFTVYRNTTTGSIISFSQRQDIASGGVPMHTIRIADIDGDGKPDIVVGNAGLNHSVSIIRNTSTVGNISFAPAIHFSYQGNLWQLAVGDIDGDGMQDIAYSTYSYNKFFVIKNTSSPGNISFAPEIGFPTESSSGGICITDLNGDAQPDVMICNPNVNAVQVFKNISASGNILFAPKVDFAVTKATYVNAGDFDADGKPEIAVGGSNTVSILKNNISQELSVKLCTPVSGTVIKLTITGASYQWQQNTGSGFVNINDGSNFGGTNTATLTLSNIALSWNGYTYRCIVDAQTDRVFKLVIYETLSPSVTITSSATSVCQDYPATFTAIPVNEGTVPVYQWLINDNVVATNTTTYSSTTLKNGANIQFKLTSNGECAATNKASSNVLQMTVINKVEPEVQITASKTVICEGETVTFTATTTNEGSNPSFYWQKTGGTVSNNGKTYTTSKIKNGDIFNCQLSTNFAGCFTKGSDVSNDIAITVNSTFSPTVTITATENTICAGQMVTFTAKSTDAGTNPTYQWYVNGTKAGTNNAVFTSGTLTNGDQVNVIVTINSTCAITNTATSNTIVMVVTPKVAPTITLSGKTRASTGELIALTAAITNGGTAQSYEWQDSTSTHNWRTVAITTANTTNYSPATTGDKIKCILTVYGGCASQSFATSAPLVFTLNMPLNTPTDTTSLAKGVHAYPNPVTTVLILDSLKLSDQWVILEITDYRGNRVLTQNINNKTKVSVPVAQLSKGLFIAILRRSNGDIASFKFLKM
jgi:photosystem II stability/assembly factor-like uncharacterized protein